MEPLSQSHRKVNRSYVSHRTPVIYRQPLLSILFLGLADPILSSTFCMPSTPHDEYESELHYQNATSSSQLRPGASETDVNYRMNHSTFQSPTTKYPNHTPSASSSQTNTTPSAAQQSSSQIQPQRNPSK